MNPSEKKTKKRMRKRLMDYVYDLMIQIHPQEIEKAVASGHGAPALALREGCGLPETALRLGKTEQRRAIVDLLLRAGAEMSEKGVMFRKEQGGFQFELRARPPLSIAADPERTSIEDVRTWMSQVQEDIENRLGDMADLVTEEWRETCPEVEPEGLIRQMWPFNKFEARQEGRQLGARMRERILTERRLDSIGFNDLRLLHRDETLPRRRILALLGPTNSGKTHQGLEILAKAGSGAYLAPLRLLAMENQEALERRGVPCSLVTGEELIEIEGATHVSSTIEMLDLGRKYDVVLIDEIQMLADESRGWAWTRALLSADAPLVIVAGSRDALPLIRRIALITGDKVEERHFQRRNKLIVRDDSLKVAELEAGDAVIAFSRRDVLGWKEMLDSKGMTSAVIYGALGPDVRRAEAARFRSGEAQILIATDAIGMGLNLPIRRVVFTTSTKYNGQHRVKLAPAQIRQIAGRAGRFGEDGPGVAAHIHGCDGRRGWISEGLSKETELPAKVRIAPTWNGVRRVMDDHPGETLTRAIERIVEAVRGNGVLSYAFEEDERFLLEVVGRSHLSSEEQFRYIGLPLSMRNPENTRLLKSWLSSLAKSERPLLPPMRAAVGDSADLQKLETEAAQCGAYAWLSRKFPRCYPEGAKARERRDAISSIISGILAKGGLRRLCSSCGTKLKPLTQHNICDSCHNSRRRNDWW